MDVEFLAPQRNKRVMQILVKHPSTDEKMKGENWHGTVLDESSCNEGQFGGLSRVSTE